MEFQVIDNGWKEGMAEEEYLLVNGVGIRKFGIFEGEGLRDIAGAGVTLSGACWAAAHLAERAGE